MQRRHSEVLVPNEVFRSRRAHPPKKKNSVTNGRRVILNARSWTMELIEGGAEEYRIIICVGAKQQQRNVREIIKTVKYRCNVIQRQNSVAEMSERSSLTLILLTWRIG